MSFQTHCNHYLQQINQTQSDPNATPELSLHPHLKTFLENVTAECFNRPNVQYTLEPRNINQIGRPDFIATDGLLPIGYIEAEASSTDLNNLTGHAKDQNDRFKQNLDNFVLTNFIDFELWTDGKRNAIARITDNTDNLKALLQKFLDASIQIGTPEALAGYLARRTRELQTQIAIALRDNNSETYQMYEAFRDTLLFTLNPTDFADMYAQTLSYGLFAARCSIPDVTNFSRSTAAEVLPQSNPFLRRLFYQVASPTLEANVTYILQNIETLLQNVPTEMLRTAFTPRNDEQDPVIHFYETFLAQYDPQRRIDRGVYYTPPQVISYIVRSVDALLKTELNKPSGLADDNTLILDPATGTGGFLLSALDHIRDYVSTTQGTGAWNLYVNDNLVKRIFGFELLVAPYTIAHLKLGLFLQTHGWNANERLRIYLTNTLELPADAVDTQPFAPFISEEANEALSVKRDQPILAIIGNPPYPLESANPSRDSEGNLTFIGRLIEDYMPEDGETLGIWDQKKPLQSDYVKFVRWAQWRIDRNGEGVVGFIVNNSFLEGATFRRMRQSLMQSFNIIYCLNLHGNSRFGETIPQNESDENVFDIQQGTVILLCVKKNGNDSLAKLNYADVWGTREKKYKMLQNDDNIKTKWDPLNPTKPYYFFSPHAKEPTDEYKSGWRITDIFHITSIGVITARDKLTIHQNVKELRETISDFAALSEDDAREKYKLRKDTQDWKVNLAQADLRNHPDADKYIKSIQYRPFDLRWTYYTGQSRGFICVPRLPTMRHLLEENFALCTHRSLRSASTWQHVFISDDITDGNCISTKDGPTHVFPLYLYPDDEGFALGTERTLNFKPEFLTTLSQALQRPQTWTIQTPRRHYT